jgi:hypothetical protein
MGFEGIKVLANDILVVASHPHDHAPVTDGFLERGGRFLPAPPRQAAAVEARFRDGLLRALHAAERRRVHRAMGEGV